MTTTITDGTTTVTPDAVEGFSSAQPSGMRLHPILGSATPDITYRPPQLRAGTLRLFFAAESDAATAATIHTTGNVLTISSTDLSTVNFSYVPAEGDGAVSVEQSETRAGWFVEVDYQEVSA